MNYGKIAYLKTLDLEQKISNIETDDGIAFSCSEYAYDSYNENFTTSHVVDYDGLVVANYATSVYIQSVITIETEISSNVSVQILANENEIGVINKKLNIGSNDVIVSKVYSGDSKNVDIKFVISSGDDLKTITSINTVFIGVTSENVATDIELRAIKIDSGVLVSYVMGNKLFIAQDDNGNDGYELQFDMHMEALSHSIVLVDGENDKKLQIFYVNNEKELKMCDFDGKNEVLLDTDVSKVFAKSISHSSGNCLVCYIKNGEPLYKTMFENKFSDARKLPLPTDKYSDIKIVLGDSEYVYVIATNKSGSNFIAKSTTDIASGFVEHIVAGGEMLVTKYYALPFINNGIVENLTIKSNISVSTYLSAAGLEKRPIVERLKISCKPNVAAYAITPPAVDSEVVYGVYYDMSNPDPVSSLTYTGDAVGLNPAYMDFAKGEFVSNGWLNRWPYNQIKPCLMDSNGNIVGYLDPNDYSKFEDGSAADIYSDATYDVMVEIPKIYFKYERIDDNTVHVQITNKENMEGFVANGHNFKGDICEKLYVAAYISKWNNSTSLVPYSISGTPDRSEYLPGVSITTANMVTYVRNKGAGYEQCPLPVFIMLQAMYLIMFKNLNSQVALGHGYLPTSTLMNTGTLDRAGMYYGEQANAPIKLFGIENLYGNGSLFLPGAYFDAKYNLYVKNPNSGIDYGYTNSTNGMDFLYNLGKTFLVNYPSKIYACNEMGFMLPLSAGGSDSTYICDTLAFRQLQRSVRTGGFNSDSEIGIFATNYAVSNSRADNVNRFVYYKRSE